MTNEPAARYATLKGKVILVTGGSRGIGEGIVRHFVAQGSYVAFSYASSGERAEQIVAELGSDRCAAFRVDLGRPGEIEPFWNAVTAWKGGIDVVVSNAGTRESVPVEASVEEFDEVWIRALRVNLVATAHLARLAILHFRKRSGGTIIAITGRIAVRGDWPDFLHDGAAKGGVNSMMRGIARAYGKDNVSTYLVCAGLTDTEQAARMIDRYGRDAMLREIPAGRLGTPDDVAKICVFVASGEAAYASGATIDVVGASFLH
jgi:3-oxoacyl-[acyl-carrier protein] reductase